MRYARETMELMAAYPGRDFRMGAIVRYIIGGNTETRKRKATREGVRLVMEHLVAAGAVHLTPAKGRGGFALYRWKVPDELMEKHRA